MARRLASRYSTRPGDESSQPGARRSAPCHAINGSTKAGITGPVRLGDHRLSNANGPNSLRTVSAPADARPRPTLGRRCMAEGPVQSVSLVRVSILARPAAQVCAASPQPVWRLAGIASFPCRRRSGAASGLPFPPDSTVHRRGREPTGWYLARRGARQAWQSLIDAGRRQEKRDYAPGTRTGASCGGRR